MSKHRVAVLKVVSAQLSVTAAAAECGISRGHLHRLLRRYRDEGLDAVEPRTGGSSPSSTSGRARSSPSTPARSSRPTASSPTAATGATNDETPADGRGLKRPADHICRRCRDSCVADVATQDNGAPGGIRTPDPLIRSQMLYPLSYGRAERQRSAVSHRSSRRASQASRGAAPCQLRPSPRCRRTIRG